MSLKLPNVHKGVQRLDRGILLLSRVCDECSSMLNDRTEGLAPDYSTPTNVGVWVVKTAAEIGLQAVFI